MAKASAISKIEAVRRAFAELGNDAMPGKIQDYVQKSFGLDMSSAHVSNYKTHILKKEPKAVAAEPEAPTAAPVKATKHEAKGAGVSLQDIEAVKALVGRVGEKNLKSLIDLVG